MYFIFKSVDFIEQSYQLKQTKRKCHGDRPRRPISKIRSQNTVEPLSLQSHRIAHDDFSRMLQQEVP